MAEHATGAVHPITDTATGWNLGHGLHAWMVAIDPTGLHDPALGPFVVLEGPDGADVTVPRALLAVLSRGIVAAHVDASRTDRWPA